MGAVCAKSELLLRDSPLDAVDASGGGVLDCVGAAAAVVVVVVVLVDAVLTAAVLALVDDDDDDAWCFAPLDGVRVLWSTCSSTTCCTHFFCSNVSCRTLCMLSLLIR
jgi:hypothetical protein